MVVVLVVVLKEEGGGGGCCSWGLSMAADQNLDSSSSSIFGFVFCVEGCVCIDMYVCVRERKSVMECDGMERR